MLRAYPSAGARYPLELYLVTNRVNKLTSQKLVEKANLVIIISAIFDRTRIKYGDRGYRFPFIEAGHLTQNLYLASEAQKLNCCAIGGFVDNKINKLLDFSDTCEKVIYIAAIGSKK